MFQLPEFKGEYQNHNIEILVDNTTTHVAKNCSIHGFGKCSGTNYSVLSIEYVNDNNEMETTECYFQSGPQRSQSKGLLAVALETSVQVPPSIELNEPKSILSIHKAFQNANATMLLTSRHTSMIGFIIVELEIRKSSSTIWCKHYIYTEVSLRIKSHRGVWCHQK